MFRDKPYECFLVVETVIVFEKFPLSLDTIIK